MFFTRFHFMEILMSFIQKLSSCFLACFRTKDKQLDQTAHTPLISNVSDDPVSNPRIEDDEALGSNCNFATLFRDKEKECGPREESTKFPFECGVDRELEDEVRFLKARGTLMEAPVEISEVPEELEWQEQPDLILGTTAAHYETLGIESSPEHTPNNLLYMEKEGVVEEEGNGGGSPLATAGAIHPIDNISAVTPLPPSATHKDKFMRFEGQLDAELLSLGSFQSQTGEKMLDQSNSSGSDSALRRSSYPTPLSISDNIETPGTIYLSCENSFVSGKTVRIRTQYVRSVLKPVDNFSQWDSQKKEDANSSLQQQQHERAIRYVEKQENEDPKFYSVTGTVFDGGLPSRAFDVDKPILGLTTAHWNYDEPFHISNKLMIANGIPNSSRKYKEDQKISWHATPFEERLEKALSWEARISQRKFICGRPIDFDENEECVSD